MLLEYREWEWDGEKRIMRGKIRGKEVQISRTSAFLLIIPRRNGKQLKNLIRVVTCLDLHFKMVPLAIMKTIDLEAKASVNVGNYCSETGER